MTPSPLPSPQRGEEDFNLRGAKLPVLLRLRLAMTKTFFYIEKSRDMVVLKISQRRLVL
jgi:hypothetical protein